MGEVHAVPIVSSDFVYVALAEETGFAGCVSFLSLWTIFLIVALVPHMCGRSQKTWGESLLMVGLAASLGIQLALNVAGVLNALPMTGITLPLLSHGGSSLVAVLAICGLLNANCGQAKIAERAS
jgi:cell division protein FtsW (lipid II flippase)